MAFLQMDVSWSKVGINCNKDLSPKMEVQARTRMECRSAFSAKALNQAPGEQHSD